MSKWADFWLPRQQAPQVLSPCIESLADAKVEILIDEEARQWNHEVIDGIFTQEDADLIKHLPLARMASEDSLFWPFSRNGIYNCKSGYQFLKAEENHGGTEANVEQEKALWKAIWVLQTPNKMKNHIWRACQNSLPTKENLVC